MVVSMQWALRMGLTVGLIGTVILVMAVDSPAQTIVATGTPTAFKVIIKQFELSSNGGQTYTTVYQGDLEVDLATVNVGSFAETIAQEVSIAAGAYDKGRITVSCTFKLKGSLTHQGTTFVTTASGGTSTNAADLAEGTLEVPDGFGGCSGGTFQEAEDLSLTVIAGLPKVVSVDVDVTSSLALYQIGPFLLLGPAPPSVSASSN